MKFLITGLSGTGKSAVAQELSRRGFQIAETDKIKSLSKWFNIETGDQINYTPPVDENWYQRNQYLWDRQAMLDLFKKTSDDDLFVCGSSYNDQKFYDLFDVVFFLVVGRDTLTQRLQARNSKKFGKSQNELTEILKWHDVIDYKKLADQHNGYVINTEQPLQKVVDEILSHVHEN